MNFTNTIRQITKKMNRGFKRRRKRKFLNEQLTSNEQI